MRVILYCRASTDDQKLTHEYQEQRMRDYAREHDVVKVIHDSASAKNIDRAGFQEALRMLRDKEADAVCVLKLDRLCRSLKDLAGLLERYFGPDAKHPSTLLSVQDHIDTSSPSGRLVLHVIGAVAEWELATIRSRTKAAMDTKRVKGEKISRYLPFGYREIPDTDPVKLEPDPDEQDVIQLMQDLRGSGKSLRKIATELNARSIPTKNGSRWHFTTIHKILNREREAA